VPLQVQKEPAHRPAWLKIMRTAYYILLKFTAMGVYFDLPAYALFHAYKRTLSVGSERWFVTYATFLAMLTLLEVCVPKLAAGWGLRH
jgi:hypothetical protein